MATGNRPSRSPAASAAGGVVADGSAAGGSEPNGVAVSGVATRQRVGGVAMDRDRVASRRAAMHQAVSRMAA